MATIGTLAPTKLQILDLLRHGPRTIHDLARALKVTDNAVRTHVVALERDRFVEPRGRRPGVRKPSVEYGLAPAADRLLPKPYASVLNLVLDDVQGRQGADEVARIATRVGQELARPHVARLGDLEGRARVDAIVGLIGELGGIVDVEARGDDFRLIGSSCPLVSIIPGHPQMCHVTEAFIQNLLGDGQVRAHCDREGDVRCLFDIDLV